MFLFFGMPRAFPSPRRIHDTFPAGHFLWSYLSKFRLTQCQTCPPRLLKACSEAGPACSSTRLNRRHRRNVPARSDFLSIQQNARVCLGKKLSCDLVALIWCSRSSRNRSPSASSFFKENAGLFPDISLK